MDDELLEAMRRETILFTRAIVREDRSVLDFVDGRFSYREWAVGAALRHCRCDRVRSSSGWS